MIAQTLHDIKYSFRMLLKNPGFATVVVFTLALGIGANAAIFSLTDKVLLQSLPVQKPEDLVLLSTYDPKDGPESGDDSFSYPMYQDLRDQNDAFSGVIAHGGAQMNVTYGEQSVRVNGELVSGNFFQTLGVSPWVGRLFTQEDDRTPGAHPVAVLSYAFWQSRFNKDLSLIGKTILINEYPVTVIGVTPPGFYGATLVSNPDVRVPLMMTPVFNPQPPTRLTRRSHQWMYVMARRKEGVSNAQAQASLDVLYQRIRESEAQSRSMSGSNLEKYMARRINLSPGAQGFQHLQTDFRKSLYLLFAATCVILLILCANLANLMLARTTVRSQEIAVRLALGAGRLRLLRQWLTEGLVLSLIGAMAGIFIAFWIRAGLLAFVPRDVHENLQSTSWRLYGFILLTAIVIGVGFSLAPAIQAARQVVNPSFAAESRSFTSAGKLLSLRSALILVQIALSLPLLVSAGLLIRTLQNLRAIDTGFDKNDVLLASINPSLSGYSPEKSHVFYDELLRRTRSLPGVTAASLASDSPISGGWDRLGLVIEGYTPKEGERTSSDVTWVSTDYFKSLRIPLLLGRDFTDLDKRGSPKVAIVNEKMARHFFGTTDVIGKHIGLEKTPDITIVGVVKDVTYTNLRENIRRHFYLPTTQEERLANLTLHIKATGDSQPVGAALRNEVKSLDPHLPLYDVKTLSEEINQSLIQERMVTWLTSAFGLVALLLTALGLYGVLTFSVARRTREIGIRVALGAQRRDVMRLVVTQGLLIVAVGIVLGLVVSYGLSKVIATLLFGVSPTNPWTLIAVTAGLFVISLFACYLPARRATKVDPLVALRYE